MPNKRNISPIYTNHALLRMNERNFTQEGVQVVVTYGEEELLPDGCKRYTLTNDVPIELLDNLTFLYFRYKKVILTPDNVVKTVINNDAPHEPDYKTFCKYVI